MCPLPLPLRVGGSDPRELPVDSTAAPASASSLSPVRTRTTPGGGGSGIESAELMCRLRRELPAPGGVSKLTTARMPLPASLAAASSEAYRAASVSSTEASVGCSGDGSSGDDCAGVEGAGEAADGEVLEPV
jgi:hypothetical protein